MFYRLMKICPCHYAFRKEKVLQQLLRIFAAAGNHATDDGWKMNPFKKMTVVNFIKTVERKEWRARNSGRRNDERK